MADQERGVAVDTRELLWKARRYRWIALLPIVLAFCAAFLYLNVAPPVYESAVIVSLEDQAAVGEQISKMIRPGERMEDMVQKVARVKNRVLNRTFLQAISDRMGLARDEKLLQVARAAARKYPDITPEEYATRVAVAGLAKKVAVTPVGSSYIRIAVKDPSPQQARRLATAVGEGLIELTRRVGLEQVQARGEFSQDQIAVVQENLRRAEDEYRAYQESVIGQSISTGPVDQGNVDAVRLLAESADKEAEVVRERIQNDRQTWASRVGTSAPMPDLRSSRTRELESRLSGLESSYGAASARGSSPTGAGGSQAQSLLQQIGSVRQELLNAYEASASTLPGDLPDDARLLAAGIALDRAVLTSLNARKARLSGMVGRFIADARSTPREQLELERRKNAVEMYRSQLEVLQRETTAARTSEAFETSTLALRIQVVEAPQLPLKPVWPDRLKVLAGALLLGPLLSVGVIVGAERVGAIVRTVEQAEEEMGTKVIGTIPRIEGWSRPGSFLENHWAPISILAILLLTALATGVYTTVTANRQHTTASSELRR